MGMFDTVRSSYPLGRDFEGPCQTKDLDGLMSCYWIDPSGQLFLIDKSGVVDFVKEDGKFGSKSNGNHGKVKPVDLFRYITIYPEDWKGHWSETPQAFLHFKAGKLMDFVIKNQSEG